MSGLILKLAAGEKVVINGALLENGDKPSSLRIADANARVLRCRDALKPEEVDTPVKQVYYAIQLLITGDLEDDRVLPALFREIEHLALQGDLKLSKLNNVDKKALCWYEECQERSKRRAKRHRERDRKAERDTYNQGIDDAALSAMMDAFEAARGRGS